MSTPASGRIAIVGGGPCGSLLAILLARRGFEPVVIERNARFTGSGASGGRSINLALAARGIDALRRAGIDAYVRELMIPMRGRMIHDLDGRQRFLAYGQRADEEIYSVSRAALNALLHRLAGERHAVEYRFNTRCVDVDAATGDPIVESAGARTTLGADVVFAADGAGSEVRRALAEQGAIEAHEELLDHGYKELTIPAGNDGGFALEPGALHIWPRGGFMLIALPNPDRSFTATLFLPHAGENSFATVGASDVDGFFRREFADAVPLLPSLRRDYTNHPTGALGTVTCRPWSSGKILLVGDAAHAIVPFHGQGMNAAFEDCVVLDRLLEQRAADGSGDWQQVFADFERLRAPNTRAIAEMAIENYQEMRDEVRDTKFELRAELSFELERRFPGRFIPRYSLVMFHPEISYAEAQRRGALEARILHELTTGVETLAAVDFARAAKLVETEL
ncbi:MAG TPA: NAD(P)/FAD-dependent oxidoreductase [Gammaproteobacteria bacterium]|nr:NAD(P)/FAD-dependent oxidoreductase [Gammaproteobacteria bacterium]